MNTKKKLERIFQKVMDRSSVHYSQLTRHIKNFSSTIGHKDLILDVGSGKSPYKSYLSFAYFFSIDIDAHMRPDVVGDVCSLPIRKESVDAIMCIEVLEHVKDVGKALIELNYVIKKDGYLVLSVPLLFGIHARADFFRWTEAGIKFCLEKAGFRVLTVETNGGIFSVIGETLIHVPSQTLKKVSWVNYGFLFLTYLSLIPIAKICIALDGLDIKKNFTTGYCVLSMKKTPLQN